MMRRLYVRSILNGRYEIIEKLELAEWPLYIKLKIFILKRIVAVKRFWKEQYLEDKEFIKNLLSKLNL